MRDLDERRPVDVTIRPAEVRFCQVPGGRVACAMVGDGPPLVLAPRGLSDGQIAERLVVSPHTVHRQVANMRAKLGEPSRAAAVAGAARLGML